jgi:hypothetical protein
VQLSGPAILFAIRACSHADVQCRHCEGPLSALSVEYCARHRGPRRALGRHSPLTIPTTASNGGRSECRASFLKSGKKLHPAIGCYLSTRRAHAAAARQGRFEPILLTFRSAANVGFQVSVAYHLSAGESLVSKAESLSRWFSYSIITDTLMYQPAILSSGANGLRPSHFCMQVAISGVPVRTIRPPSTAFSTVSTPIQIAVMVRK